jgi:hypothetical protein
VAVDSPLCSGRTDVAGSGSSHRARGVAVRERQVSHRRRMLTKQQVFGPGRKNNIKMADLSSPVRLLTAILRLALSRILQRFLLISSSLPICAESQTTASD